MINAVSKRESDTGGRALQDVRVRTLDRWDRAFQSRRRHGCGELITRSEESSRVCVCVCLIVCDLET